MKKIAIALGIIVAAAGIAVATLQDGMGGEKQDEQPQGFKPGKEHEVLKEFVGEFECETKFWMDPAQPPMKGTGTDTSKLSLGGLWLIYDFKSKDFEGHGTMGYDPVEKKYVATWIDSMMPFLMVGKGDYDAGKKEFTFMVDARDMMTNEPVKEKWVLNIKDRDAHLSTFWRPDPKTGKDAQIGEIKYKRKK